MDGLACEHVTHLSLDHDLGEGEPSGYELCLRIRRLYEERTSSTSPMFVSVHSANPIGRKHIVDLVTETETSGRLPTWKLTDPPEGIREREAPGKADEWVLALAEAWAKRDDEPGRFAALVRSYVEMNPHLGPSLSLDALER